MFKNLVRKDKIKCSVTKRDTVSIFIVSNQTKKFVFPLKFYVDAKCIKSSISILINLFSCTASKILYGILLINFIDQFVHYSSMKLDDFCIIFLVFHDRPGSVIIRSSTDVSWPTRAIRRGSRVPVRSHPRRGLSHEAGAGNGN